MKITDKLLRRYDACERQRQGFNHIFPHGCQPTVENLTLLSCTTCEGGFNGSYCYLDVLWLADHVRLDCHVLQEFNCRLQQYDDQLDAVADGREAHIIYMEHAVAQLSALLMAAP